MKLHLGVADIPYVTLVPKTLRSAKARRRKGAAAGGVTTVDVARWLERRYHVMEVFYEAHQDEIANDLADAVQIALEDMMSGAPPTDIPFAAGTARIGENFKKFLYTQEVERMGIPGVPTGAAKRGVSHRFKHPYAKRGARPSFIDTGTYEGAFEAWVE